LNAVAPGRYQLARPACVPAPQAETEGSMSVTPQILTGNREIREMLLRFDFEPMDNAEYGPVWFETAPLKPFDVVAQRGSGCVYATIGPERHVVLVTTEGRAGVVAGSLRECLELVIAHPYWQEVVSRCNGDLEAMRRTFRDDIEELEEEALDDDPDIEEFRSILRERLGLGIPEDPGGSLHHALTVLGADLRVCARIDGAPSEPLFGRRSRR
jgi:hypothetical protein